MKIRILGAHNVESTTTRCVSLLVDDAIALDAGGLTSGLSVADQRRLKAVLLSHQHYDHIRDIPALALNFSQNGNGIRVYAPSGVRRAIETHLLNGTLYPEFQKSLAAAPAVDFRPIEPYERQQIEGYQVLAVPVNHCQGAVGYQLSDDEGKAIFYTADTGPGLSRCWDGIAPHLILADVTVPNEYEKFARTTRHLTPALLQAELGQFREMKGYLPEVVIVHMNPSLEKDIAREMACVASALSASITLAREGMQLTI